MTTSEPMQNLHAATQLFELWGGLNDGLMDIDKLIEHAKELRSTIVVHVFDTVVGVPHYNRQASHSAYQLHHEYTLFVEHSQRAKVEAGENRRREAIKRLKEMIAGTPAPAPAPYYNHDAYSIVNAAVEQRQRGRHKPDWEWF